jgi:hypothetical protein
MIFMIFSGEYSCLKFDQNRVLAGSLHDIPEVSVFEPAVHDVVPGEHLVALDEFQIVQNSARLGTEMLVWRLDVALGRATREET